MTHSELTALAHKLRTQDNACTADPIYLVQVERTICGLDRNYCEGEYLWYFPDDGEFFDVPEDGEGLPLSEEEAEEFGYEKVYYKTIYEFKCAHFTLAAAEQYIETQRHNLDNPRIFVDSMHRCPEMIAIRKFLMDGGQIKKGSGMKTSLLILYSFLLCGLGLFFIEFIKTFFL